MMQTEWADVPKPQQALGARGRSRQLDPTKATRSGASRARRTGPQLAAMALAVLALGLWSGCSRTRHARAPAADGSMEAGAASADESSASLVESRSPPAAASSAVAAVSSILPQPSSTPPPSPSASGNGYVSVLCQPYCETVLIDGRQAGPSPVIRWQVAAGERSITLKRGTQTRTSVLKVKAGELSQLSVKMDDEAEVEPGQLTVVCSPFCEAVLVDSKNVGASPLVRLSVAPGVHAITLKRAATVKVLSATVKSGEITTLRVSMAP